MRIAVSEACIIDEDMKVTEQSQFRIMTTFTIPALCLLMVCLRTV